MLAHRGPYGTATCKLEPRSEYEGKDSTKEIRESGRGDMSADLWISPQFFFSSVGFSFASSGMFASRIPAASVRILTRLCALVLVVAVGLGAELRVRVRLSDGLVTEEVLEADSERDAISLEFKQGDGTLVTFVADFKQVRAGPVYHFN